MTGQAVLPPLASCDFPQSVPFSPCLHQDRFLILVLLTTSASVDRGSPAHVGCFLSGLSLPCRVTPIISF